MYFHTDDANTLHWFANVVSRAEKEGLPLRLNVTELGELQVKLGGGIWTAPITSTFDLSRDVQ